jgi:hypothetical protein
MCNLAEALRAWRSGIASKLTRPRPAASIPLKTFSLTVLSIELAAAEAEAPGP